MITTIKLPTLTLTGRLLLTLLLALLLVKSNGQETSDWHKLLANGANYYDIKAAFYKQHSAKIAEMQSQQPGEADEEENEGAYFDIMQFMRWAQFTEPRVAESKGDLGLMYQKQLKGNRQVNTLKQNRSLFGNDNWTLIGPKTQANSMYGNGRVNRLRVDPTNPNILYACTPASQLFKSTNGGISWTSISNGFPTAGVGDVAIDPSDPNTLYATTGDSDYFNAKSDGVYKSTDGGLTWHKLTSLPMVPADDEVLTSIVMNPALPGSFLVSSTRAIYRFTNGGATVVKVAFDGARDLSVMPGNPGIMFAGSHSSYYGATKFVRSGDNGVTWTAITSGLPPDAFRYAISISPVNPNMVYVWTSAQSTLVSQGVYCSTDAGLTFKKMNSGTPNMCSSQGNYNLCLAADPTNGATLYAGGIDVYRSTDSGKTWVNLTNQYSGSPSIGHPDVHGLSFSGASTLYVANDGGVYKTTNAGASFSNISSDLSIGQSYGISMSSYNSKLIISGHQDNGTNISGDLVNWRWVTGGDGLLSLIDRTNDNIMFTTSQFGAIYRSIDGGTNFGQIGASITKGIIWGTPLVQDAHVASTIYAASDKVYKSTDYGTSWNAISPVFSGGIVDIAVDRNNSNIMYLAKYFELYKTVDGGTNWTPINNGFTPAAQMSSIHIDVNNSSIIYAACGSYSGSLFRSVDAGASWALYTTGLPNLPARVVVTQLGAPGEVYCGTDNGVFYRNAASTSWTLFNSNLPAAPVYDLKIFYPTSTLRAATFGRGIWESPLAAAAVSSCPVTFTDNRAYVDSSASGTNTGKSWANAFRNLQDAIHACGVKEIWVAKGTYYPDQGAGISPGDYDQYFSLRSNLAIYGGFLGNETLLAQRNWRANQTILSGDVGTLNDFADNSYNVLQATGTDASAILDGFTVTEGNANANSGVNPQSRGGGIYIGDYGSPAISNCVFVKNYGDWGGGVYVKNNTYPVISNCVFMGNDAYDGTAIGNETGSHATIINCSNSGNSNHAITLAPNSAPVIKNCIIWGNTAGINGALATVSNSIVQGGYPGTGNLDVNPLFVSQPAIALGATGNLHVTACSPAIDAGNDAATTTTFDLDGDSRKTDALPNAALVDMGAYERNANLNTLYVDIAATGKGDGTGWINAQASLYNALSSYNGCPLAETILIATGTYTAPQGQVFVLDKTGGTLLGGYPTGGGGRNPAVNPVNLIGDIKVLKPARVDGVRVIKP